VLSLFTPGSQLAVVFLARLYGLFLGGLLCGPILGSLFLLFGLLD